MHSKKLKINFVRFTNDSELFREGGGAHSLISAKGGATKKFKNLCFK